VVVPGSAAAAGVWWYWKKRAELREEGEEGRIWERKRVLENHLT
jgi:hypothetical protein